MESEKAKMLKTLSETYSQLCGQTITPENVMDVVRNDLAAPHPPSDHSIPVIHIKHPKDPCHTVSSPNTSTLFPTCNSEEIVLPVTSDFTTQTKDNFGVQQSVSIAAEIPDGPSMENYWACVSEENGSNCSSEWNDFFAAEF
jgi:hypothetical protein